MLLPDVIKDFLHKLQKFSIPARSMLSEEEQSIPSTFDIEVERENIEGKEGPIDVKEPAKEVKFEAFLDGVQRTVLWRRVQLPNGALVPIHIAHIAAGIMLRDDKGKLFLDQDLVASRLLVLGPFEGLSEEGVEFDLSELDGKGVILDTNIRTFDFPEKLNEWIVCDTTFRGTSEDRNEKETEGALLGNNLFNEGLIRSRAQGRVATLRQRLEFALLTRFRKKYPERWILVDGPLFFIDKWRRRAANIYAKNLESSERNLEDKLLYRAVGLIKTHRLRPKHPEQVIKIGPAQRSPVVPITKEVDIKGCRSEPDESGTYGGAHLTWYTRLLRNIPPPYGLFGLVRLDVHRTTLGLKRIDHLTPDNFKEYRPIIDGVTRAVWRERWPAVGHTNDYRKAVQIYPIEQIERVLKAMLVPRRLLAFILGD